ncbi:hypothetical protein DY245_32515 [Streptomyces inhibens]|uniref:VOC domain-containing protein n=2 Tax=Streptomyces inhibens TaxID=2293571 RepID=A0A371PVA4_STRIH|nr:hypothetical protein DY245_32515 [Streptomyces inhibens]
MDRVIVRGPGREDRALWQLGVAKPIERQGGPVAEVLRERAHRVMLGAVRHVVDNGVKWANLPADFPPYRRVHAFARRRQVTGLLAELHDRPRGKVREQEGRSPDPTAAIVDSQSVRAAANIPRPIIHPAGVQLVGSQIRNRTGMGVAPLRGQASWADLDQPVAFGGRLLPSGVETVAMGSLWEELSHRKATARERVERTREQNAELNRRLVAEEEAPSRLVITWETVEEILGDAAPGRARDGGDATASGETGGQIDQDSRSAGHGAAHSLIVMDITIHTSFLPHDDPDASLAFYRDTLGFEVRSDVGQGTMRWITVGPVGQPGTSILLAPPAADPGVTEDERRTIAEMMAKGTYGWILLATRDLDGTFEKVQAGDAEVVQEPTEQPYGIRDCAFRDPAGNLVRIQELR